MGENSAIEWTHHTLNPWEGCQRKSPGCEHCYAEARDRRFTGGSLWGPKGKRRRTVLSNWRQAFKWNLIAKAAGERHRVFCASLADVFEDRPELVPWRFDLFVLIRMTPHLDWLLLTKRPENVLRMVEECARRFGPQAGGGYTTSDTEWDETRMMLHRWINGTPPANVWVGATMEDQQRANERLPLLLSIPARIHFASIEPQLSRVSLVEAFEYVGETQVGTLDWAIIGGESGDGARPFHVEWARSLLADCERFMIAPFVKQMGNVPVMDESAWREQFERAQRDGSFFPLLSAANKDRALPGTVPLKLAHKKGGDMAEWSIDLQVREFPSGFPK